MSINKRTKLTFVGDAMCEQEQISAHKIGDNKYDFIEVFSSMNSYFENSDYVVANLETPVAGQEFEYSNKKWSFNTPIEFASALKISGVDLVSTANNHCLDRGTEGIKKTIENLDIIKLKHIGTYAEQKKKNVLIEDINGIKIAFLSYTYGTNAFSNNKYLSKKEKYMVNLLQEQELSNIITRICYKNPEKFYSKVYRNLGKIFFPQSFKTPVYERKEKSRRSKKQMKTDLRLCKKSGAEYIIMLIHSGGQYNAYPTKLTVNMSKYLIKNGADAIIVNHEHVVHQCYINNSNRNKIITYSLGNFSGMAGVVKGPYDKMAEYSIVFNIYLTKNALEIIVDKCTFSITKSVLYSENKIKTVLLYDLIKKSKNEEETRELIKDNLKIVNTFLNRNFQTIDVKEEYNIKQLI